MAADGVRTEAEEYAASAAVRTPFTSIYCNLGPDHALAAFSGHMQLGDTYSMLGQLDRSIACYADGLHIPPIPESPRPRLAGNVISFGLFLSPSPTFYGIFKRKTTEQFKPDPYLATVMSCMLWVFYGMPFVHPNSLLVVTINSIGLALEGIYLTIYFVYGSKSQRLKVFKFLALEIGTMALIVVLVLTLAHTYAKRTLIVGILCVIFGTCMYASPLTVMRNVIRTKSVRFMPFYLSLANFSNGVCWTIYGLIEFDVNILIPNGLGGIFGAIQLILYACYYSSTTWEDEVDDKQQTELGPLPTTNPSSIAPQSEA